MVVRGMIQLDAPAPCSPSGQPTRQKRAPPVRRGFSFSFSFSFSFVQSLSRCALQEKKASPGHWSVLQVPPCFQIVNPQVQVERCIFYADSGGYLYFRTCRVVFSQAQAQAQAAGLGQRAAGGGGGGGWRGFTHSAETGTKGEQVRTRGRRGYQGRCRRTRASAEHGRRSRGRIHASAKQEAA